MTPPPAGRDAAQRDAPIVVVSGLPRSGTSMVMRMLSAGGLEIISDGVRAADESNPKGYYEDERVKTLDKGTDNAWLEEARGKAIKIISFLLRDLPDTCRYRVVFMHRDMDEVLASQRQMLRDRGLPDDAAGDDRLARGYRDHLETTRRDLARRRNFSVLDVRYHDVVARPLEEAARIAEFVGLDLDVSTMAQAVDGALYRHRREHTGSS